MIEYTVKVFEDRTEWYLGYFLHREDGPAVEYANGNTFWFRNGLRHREDGPAYEGANGWKEWYRNGLLHREDGPAIEYTDGTKEWWMNGVPLSEEEFLKRTCSCEGKVVEIEGKKYRLSLVTM